LRLCGSFLPVGAETSSSPVAVVGIPVSYSAAHKPVVAVVDIAGGGDAYKPR